MTPTEAGPIDAPTAVGMPGTVRGVTELLGVDTSLEPTADVATTVTVCATPLVKPVMVHANGPEVQVHDLLAGEAVAVYDVIAESPAETDADHADAIVPFPGVTLVMVGDEGGSAYVKALLSVAVPPGVVTTTGTAVFAACAGTTNEADVAASVS